MAQLEAEYGDEGVTDTQTPLQKHLKKHNVSDGVYKLLEEESINQAELSTFTNDELKDWCNEHNLKTIERKRFITAVKALPNAQINKSQKKQVIKIYLSQEEKEQMTQFNKMKQEINEMTNDINEIKCQNKSKVDKIMKEINQTCDQIQEFVEQLRNKSIQIVYVSNIIYVSSM